MPLVVVTDPNGFCVEDEVAPWCATCYDVCGCAAFSECVVLTCRVVRGRLFSARNNTVWFTCHRNVRATVFLASSFLAQHGGPECVAPVGLHLV